MLCDLGGVHVPQREFAALPGSPYRLREMLAAIWRESAAARLRPGEEPMMKRVRFRTLGCYPLTGAVESTATTLPEIIEEMLLARNSEREGRVIDHDEAGSMEQKKREGYF